MTNNVSNIKQMQNMNQGTTKFIQLQPNKPILSSANVTLVTPQSISTASAAQTQSISSVTRTTVTGLPNTPAGMVLQRHGNGQIVFVNGAHIMVPPNSSSNASQSNVTTVVNKNSSAHSSQVSVSVPTTTLPTTSSNKILPTTLGVTAVTHADVKAKNIQLSQEDQVNVTKCRNFLTTLIKLAAKDGFQETQKRVKMLVQQLIDDKVTPQDFTDRLQHLLNSNPQPYLVPFLSKSLPLLRLSMCQQNNKLGEVPITIAENAIRVSTNPDNIAKQTTVGPQKSKLINKNPKPINKLARSNNVPDIRLPRAPAFKPTLITSSHQSVVSSVGSAPTGGGNVLLSGQTYSIQHSQQPPHPSSVAGATSSVLTATVRQFQSKGNNRYATANFPAATTINTANTGSGGGSYKDDDDINDVATMAGVNLSEESARIQATTELVGTQARSCKDETSVNQDVLQQAMTTIASKKSGIQHIHADAVKYLACAMEHRVKDLVEKLASVVSHRHINLKEDEHHISVSDVKSQLKFLQELDQIEKKRHEEAEKEALMKVIKSRSKNDNPDLLRLKERAKQHQQAEMEKIQQRNADQTALNAIGPRKKRRLMEGGATSTLEGMPLHSTPRKITRPRMKRANLRDFVFVMENEKGHRKSKALFRSYIK